MNKSIALTLSILLVVVCLAACRYSDAPPAAPTSLSDAVPAHGDTAFPAEGLRSIFRSDFPFVTRLIDADPA